MPNVKKTALPAHEPGKATLSHETANSKSFNFKPGSVSKYRQLKQPVILYFGQTVVGEAPAFITDKDVIQVNVSDYYNSQKKVFKNRVRNLNFNNILKTEFTDSKEFPVKVVIDLFTKHIVNTDIYGQPDYIGTYFKLSQLQHPYTFGSVVKNEDSLNALSVGYYLVQILNKIITENFFNGNSKEILMELRLSGILPRNIYESVFELMQDITTLSKTAFAHTDDSQCLIDLLEYYYRLMDFFFALNAYAKENIL